MRRRSISTVVALVTLVLLPSFISACIFRTEDEGPLLPGPSQVRELARDVSGIESLSMSHDGGKMLYVTVPNPERNTAYLVVRDARVGRAEQLLEDSPVVGATWGPDSGILAYTTYFVDEKKGAITLQDEEGLAPEDILELLSHDAISAPAWSPDGRFIVIWSHKNMDEKTIESAIRMIRPNGTDLKTLYGGPGAKSIGTIVGDITWSPDSSKLLFTMNRGDTINAFLMERRGGDPKNLTSNHLKVSDLYWSPTGKKIGYAAVDKANPNGAPEVWVMNADGSQKEALGPHGRPVGWIPNSRELVYIALEKDRGPSWPSQRLEAVDPKTKAVRLLAEEKDAYITAAAASRDSRAFYVTVEPDGYGKIKVVE